MVKILLSFTFFSPIVAFAHLISINATTPFPSTVSEYSITTATFTVTNITSGAIVNPIDQSQFPKGSGLSVLSSTLGAPLAPGESCTITLQLQPTSAQSISTALKVWAQPSLDGVKYPINITVLPVETHDVIVIGAGISGLEAASVLQENNLNVLILEARNRIGGRIETTTMDGLPIDLGASWLHDIDNNILADLATELDVTLIDTPVTGIGVYNHGIAINPDDITAITTNYPALFHALLSRTYAYCGPMGAEVSFSGAVDCFVQTITPQPPDPIYVSYAYNAGFASWYAANTTSVSSVVGPGYLNLGHDAVPQIGYTNFLYQLFDIDSLNINLNSIVNTINYTNDQVVINTTDGKAYSAKYVVVTVPLGVLQSNSIQFTPSLPITLQTAIQNFGFGSLDKVWLSFDTVFWAPDQTVTFLYTPDELLIYYMVYNFNQSLHQPILLVFSMGEFATAQESLSNDQIVANVMAQIRLIYPSAPDPLQTNITRWAQDPYSLGAYSYQSLNTTYQDIVNLTLPVQNKLFFAGEAINQIRNGTADAAYSSGLNAATAILQVAN